MTDCHEPPSTPLEICQRYAAGLIDRAQLVDELTRFPYVKGGQTDGYDSLIVDPPGTWSEVEAAVDGGLIGEDIYEEVFNRRHGRGKVREVCEYVWSVGDMRAAGLTVPPLTPLAARPVEAWAVDVAVEWFQTPDKEKRRIKKMNWYLHEVLDGLTEAVQRSPLQ